MGNRTLTSVAGLLVVAASVVAAPVASAPPPHVAATYPGATWEHAAPADIGFRPARLDELAAEARRTGSTCLLVARRGRVVGEWDWRGVAADQPREVFSVTKSVTGTLVGIAEAEGSLALDDRAARFVPAWRGTDAARVRIDNLLRNDSGRHWDVETDYGGLVTARNRSRFAVRLPQDHRPGAAWAYNNAAIQTLDPVLTAATGTTPAAFAASRLFAPLGMTHTRMTTDPSGGTNTFFGLQSTCRDLARLGYLYLRHGRWADGSVVPRSWVRRAVGDSSQRHNAAYGRLWWVNRRGPLLGPLQTDAPGQAPPETVGRLVPGAPAALFAALGLGGQVVLVDPASETVVVRLGELGHRRQYGVADAARVITEALR